MTQEQHDIAMALYQLQGMTNWLKFLKRQLEDIVHLPMERQLSEFRNLMLTHYSDYGMIERIARQVDDCEIVCQFEAVAKLIDELKTEWADPELVVNNDTIIPVSIYKGDTLIGVARNTEALVNVRDQIKEKHLSGYYLMYEGDKYKFDENGVLEEPTRGYLVNTTTLELLKKLAKQDNDESND